MKKLPPPPETDKALREHVLYLLQGGGAHIHFDDTIAGFPPKLRGAKPAGAEHSPWQILEHMRLAQWDILDFSTNPNYKELRWPEDYWPKSDAPPTRTAWDKSIKSFRADLDALLRLVSNSKTDLFTPIPWGEGQTILREALLVADHNAYHLGEFVLLRRLLGAWQSRWQLGAIQSHVSKLN